MSMVVDDSRGWLVVDKLQPHFVKHCGMSFPTIIHSSSWEVSRQNLACSICNLNWVIHLKHKSGTAGTVLVEDEFNFSFRPKEQHLRCLMQSAYRWTWHFNRNKNKKSAPSSLIWILLFTSNSYLVYSRLVPVYVCCNDKSSPYITQADPESRALPGMPNIP